MKVINATTIGNLIKAHMEGDERKFLSYQKSRRVPRLTYWIRRAVNAWGMDIGSEKLASFSDL